VIEVSSNPNPTKYRTTCTDTSCRVILTFDETDVKRGSRYMAGRKCGSYEGIVCPECNQILVRKDFEVIG
jgi:hypothetical protein